MTIFNIEKTVEDKAREDFQIISKESTDGLGNFIDSFSRSYCYFWANNPQGICDVMGDKAHELFQKSGATVQFIQSFIPEYQPPAVAKDFTINNDGTVTIGS